MAWIKRNLYWVGGGLLALVLFALAGWFLYVKIDEDARLTEELNTATETLKKLSTQKPHPGTAELDNIAAATREEKALADLLRQMKQLFPQPAGAATSTNAIDPDEASKAFVFALTDAIEKLQQKAVTYGVELPPKFGFTFEPHQGRMSFPTNAIGPLAAQLTEVRQLVDVVLSAKPSAIVGLRRIPVAPEDTGAQSFLVDKPVTNKWAILIPYEITFQGSSGQLAAVLEGFMRGNHNFVVYNVRVPPPNSAPAPSTMDTGMEPTTATTVTSPARRTGPGIVLSEKTLKIILDVYAVQMKPST